jgi:hypothetical protein
VSTSINATLKPPRGCGPSAERHCSSSKERCCAWSQKIARAERRTGAAYRLPPQRQPVRTMLAALMQCFVSGHERCRDGETRFFDIQGEQAAPTDFRLKANPVVDKHASARFGSLSTSRMIRLIFLVGLEPG